MKAEVRFYSRSGNTKKIAEEIAYLTGSHALGVDSPVTEQVDVLFVGGALYGGKLDDALVKFLAGLDARTVKSVAAFGTSASGKSIRPVIEKALEGKNIPVLEECFDCKGKFLFIARKHPNTQDLCNAVAFATRVVKN